MPKTDPNQIIILNILIEYKSKVKKEQAVPKIKVLNAMGEKTTIVLSIFHMSCFEVLLASKYRRVFRLNFLII